MSRCSLWRDFTLAFLAMGSLAWAEEGVDYARQVKPVLMARCFACHGALQQKSGLRLDTVGLMKQGGDNGAAIVTGKSNESALIQRVLGEGKVGRMPPKSEGDPLTAAEIGLLRAWIDQGAVGPVDEKPEADPRDHWAFKPIRKPEIRNAKSEIRNPIDQLLSVEQEKLGLVPQMAADRSLLLRRVYLDLVGLPPTPEEIRAALSDNAPDWYEKVVDRLLDSPQYGERWGRHWMDVWRYSDWWGLGAEVRNSQKHIWHWRDWIVESVNADKGYDQMVREMLAADELYPTDPDKLRATGFLVRSYFIFNRNTWLEETTEHTAKAFLGLTINCAKCHDHKYDPIAQQDFYRLRAFFEPYQVRTDIAGGETDFTKNGMPRVFDCNLDAPTYLFIRGDEKNPKKNKAILPGVPELLAFDKLAIAPVTLPPEAHNPGLRADVLAVHLRAAEQKVATARASLEEARKALAVAEKAPKPAPEKAVEIKPLIRDDFKSEKADLWEKKTGKWLWQNGRLEQQQDGANRAALRLKAAAPVDFEARLNFVIRGGQMYKSIGIEFDVTPEQQSLAYISAVAGGSKVQIALGQGGQYAYPTDGMQARAVPVNEPIELTLRVRGTVINVAVNGEHALAYRLPGRRKGALELITYDARAEFTSFSLAELPADLKLIEPGKANAATAPLTVEQARLAVVHAEKALAAAEGQPVSLKARAEAERERASQPMSAKAKELARIAARAEKQAALATAEEAVAQAKFEKAAKKPDAEKKLTAAKTALTQAQKALETPGEVYTPLRGSMKAPESNLETQASRDKPFPATSSGRRSALAKWITDARNPLAARVAVNHLWLRHFGKPLVATVFDFGRKGAVPTHPELLDWLAAEFRDSGWSMKKMHRLMVTSQAYRRTSSSANVAAANLKSDPENRHYWRMNPQRMQAQVVRDSLLHLSGELDLTRGGPTIPAADENSRRRSLYFFHSHNEYSKFLSIFDDANVLECYRRSESIVPQQALALENSKLALAAAEKIVRRLATADDAAFLKAAFETILGSTPTAEELAACAEAYKELLDLAKQAKRADVVDRARANFVHALLNHNDFLTVR